MSCTQATGVARALAERGGVLARAAGERGGRGSKWAACWRGADVEGHRLARGGSSRWSGGAASTVIVLPGAPKRNFGRHPRFFRVARASFSVWRLQWKGAKPGKSLGCSGVQRGEREAGREKGSCCPERTNVIPSFLHIASSGRKVSK